MRCHRCRHNRLTETKGDKWHTALKNLLVWQHYYVCRLEEYLYIVIRNMCRMNPYAILAVELLQGTDDILEVLLGTSLDLTGHDEFKVWISRDNRRHRLQEPMEPFIRRYLSKEECDMR